MSFISRDLKYRTLTFTGSATSAELDIGCSTVVGVIVPASFTATTLKLQSAEKLGGTYVDEYLVDQSMTTTLFQFTVDGTASRQYSFGGSFPPDVRYAKFVAGSSITNSIIVITKEI